MAVLFVFRSFLTLRNNAVLFNQRRLIIEYRMRDQLSFSFLSRTL